ncbi:MAG: hypothetical protein BGO16_11795 [Nitrobacter sp. 62-23]|nr:MAG: hypothetical protein BGO16_11795 [Nitrobacter sp. 62-23]
MLVSGQKQRYSAAPRPVNRRDDRSRKGFLTRFLDANRCRVKPEDMLHPKTRRPAIRMPIQGFDKRAADAY